MYKLKETLFVCNYYSWLLGDLCFTKLKLYKDKSLSVDKQIKDTWPELSAFLVGAYIFYIVYVLNFVFLSLAWR